MSRRPRPPAVPARRSYSLPLHTGHPHLTLAQNPFTNHALPMKTPLIPDGFQASAAALAMSPGIVSGDHIFLTGITGSGPDGFLPSDPEAQFRAIFNKAAGVLAAAKLPIDAIVEMTSYHIGLRDHFDLFDTIRRDVFTAPYPAWTAIEAAGLRREGALVEIRFVARSAP